MQGKQTPTRSRRVSWLTPRLVLLQKKVSTDAAAAEPEADGLANGTEKKVCAPLAVAWRRALECTCCQMLQVTCRGRRPRRVRMTSCVLPGAEEEDTEVLLTRGGGSRGAGSEWNQRTSNRKAGKRPAKTQDFCSSKLCSMPSCKLAHLIRATLLTSLTLTGAHVRFRRRKRKRRSQQSSQWHGPCQFRDARAVYHTCSWFEGLSASNSA